MRYYPLFMDLTKTSCLVLGAGLVGRRKLATIIKCSASSICVIDIGLDEDKFEELCKKDGFELSSGVSFEQRTFRNEDLNGRMLVFACTDDMELNTQVAELCADKNILCNVANVSDAGNFLVPSHVEKGPLTLAISSSGLSPAFTKVLRQDFEKILDDQYIPFLKFMEYIRPQIKGLGLSSDENAKILRALVATPTKEKIIQSLEQKNIKVLQAVMQDVFFSSSAIDYHVNIDFEGLY